MNFKTLWNDNWSFVKTSVDVEWEDLFHRDREKWEPLWQPVDLPHDWLIYNTLELYENSVGWYRREISGTAVSELVRGKEDAAAVRTILRFDGVYMDSTLYVNGRRVGDWKYGYSTFEWDITDYLTEDSNEVVMKVVHQAPNSRWYSGAGIYRNVWLVQVPEVHIPSDGIYVSTVEKGSGYELLIDTEVQWGGQDCSAGQQASQSGSGGAGVQASQSDSCGAGLQDCSYGVVYLLTHEGETIFRVEKSLEWGQEKDSAAVFVDAPKRWDITEPDLYALTVFLVKKENENGDSGAAPQIVQQEGVRVGFRTTAFLPEQGFLLNGRKVRLNGACDHHDLGALGAAFSKAAMKRKFQKMRSMGVNALRTSHNMPAPEVMALADEMGFLVVAEAFDMWEIAKNPYDYARFFKEWAEKDVRSWIRRDRNHPSVIMWSIGNEIADTHVSTHGQEITRRLMEYVRRWDYRCNAPITIGSNYMPWENARKCADIVKLAGYNYAEKYYEEHHGKYPDWVIYGSETSSVVQSRGVYHFPLERATLIEEDEQCSALGNSTTSWAAKNAEYCIAMDRDTEYSCGQFIWTAFDYIGEPTPYQTKNSYFGQMDTAGFPKDSFYLYQAEWTDYHENPMVHLYPYWDFNPGQQIDIRVCSNAPEIELFVNGQSLGRRKIDHEKGAALQPGWKVAYEPGYIEAVAYDGEGREIARKARHSFGDSYKIVAQADKEILKADGRDLIFVEISTEDREGYPVENAADYVRVTVSGPARLVGLDNGDSTDYDQYKGVVRKLFNGRLLAILASRVCESGEIVVRIEDARAQGGNAGGAPVCAEGAKEANLLIAAELHLRAVASVIIPGVSAHTENTALPLAFVEPGFVPVRKIELSVAEGSCNAGAVIASNGDCSTKTAKDSADDESAKMARAFNRNPRTLTPENPQAIVEAALFPKDATDDSLIWKAVDVAGMESRIARVQPLDGGRRAQITGLGDGDFLVRCMSRNGTDKVKLISQLEMKVEGMGCAFANPYELVSGMTYSRSRGDVGRGTENSACTDKVCETQLTYENLDFGDYGSDEVTLSIYANDSDAHSIQIWQGVPEEEGSGLLGDVIYQKPGEWEVFQTETYRLDRRLSDIAAVTIVAHDKLFLKGFYFTKIEKAFEKLFVAQMGVIYGDSYERLAGRVEHIGNNVSFAYEGMDFGVGGTHRITICGRTPLERNTIQLRFSGEEESTQVVEFPHSAEYTCMTFELEPVYGNNRVTFVFLPGCSFDFEWFQFL